MDIPRILLAAGASGSGKTLITCGLLQALVNRKMKVASFKCGPDYIDPMFHSRVIGTKSRNLDTFFTDAETTRYLLGKNAADCDIAVMEGVMGYYDGVGGISTKASAYDLADTTDTPVILVVNSRGMSISLAAYIKGFMEYKEKSHIKGVIFNQMSPMLYPRMKKLLEEELSVKVLGYVPKVEDCVIESRHLGLVLPEEIPELKNRLGKLSEILEKTLDIDGILKLAGKAPYEKLPVVEKGGEDAVSQTRNNPFMAKLQRGEKVIAVELDPPFNQDAQKLMEGAFQLKQSGVDIITIADSPLARARADSVLLAAKVSAMVDIPVMPHIACRDRNRISMHSTLLGAHINGIRNLMIVTGDPVPSGERDNTKSVFDFNSIRFMEYVKELNQEIFLQDAFSYGGALNQNQANEDQVMKRMQKKIDAGLSWFMTQPIYSDEEVEKLGRMKQELNTKILCGIMPLVSYRNAMFIKNEMPGIQVPDEIVAQYRPDMSRAEAEDVAVRISLSIMEKLEEVADGFYFMTPFNRVSLITRIIHARKPQ